MSGSSGYNPWGWGYNAPEANADWWSWGWHPTDWSSSAWASSSTASPQQTHEAAAEPWNVRKFKHPQDQHSQCLRCPWPGQMTDTFPKPGQADSWKEVQGEAEAMGLKVQIRSRAPLERIWLRHGRLVEVADDLPEAATSSTHSGARQADGKRKKMIREFWLVIAGEDMAGARMLMAEILDAAEKRAG